MSKKEIAEQQKRIKPGECLKYITTLIDPAILSDSFGGQITNILTSNSITVATANPLADRSISWERLSADNTTVPVEDHALIVWSATRLLEHIQRDDLLPALRNVQKAQLAGRPITLLICGLTEKQCTDRIDRQLIRLQLHTNIGHRLLADGADVAQTIFMYTKSVAETPYKQQMSANLEGQAFYVTADNRDCVAVRGTVGLTNLWQHQLCKMPMATLETAEAIIGAFAMPRLLLEAYAEDDGADLLTNVPVRRAGGPLTSVRKIGPELSRRMYQFFTSDNPELIL